MKKTRAPFVLICLALCLLLISNARAATFTAASCSLSDVQTQVIAARDGDTISIPAGTCSWSSGVQMNKGVTIQGAGATSTVLTQTGSGSFFLIPYTVSGGDYRITALGLAGTSSGGTDLSINGNFASLRIDHLNITTSSSRALWIGAQNLADTLYGYPQNRKILIDHIQYTPNGDKEFMLLYGGNLSWAEDDGLGTDNYVFIEDSTFNYTGYSMPITDSEFGGRFVFRYNTVTNSGGINTHDLGSTPRSRGTRLIEVYNNTFTCTHGNTCYTTVNFNRGGSGLFYNNVITGKYQAVNWPEIYRVGYSDSWVGSGYCNRTGSRTMCQDAVLHCLGGTRAGRPCYGDYDCPSGSCKTDYTCSSNSDCLKPDGSIGLCMQIDGSGAGGYPCRDQMGRGKDDPTTGVQTSLPAYWWNNTMNGSVVNPIVPSWYSSYIQEGRDYCNHSPAATCGSKTAWTYTPYTYPHPLQTGGSAVLAAPSNLRVTQ